MKRELFFAWLATLPDSHGFDMRRNDPFTQFFRATTSEQNITVGLGWYSFDKFIPGTKERPCEPLKNCHALPAFAAKMMWDRSLGPDFTKARLVASHPA